MGVLNLRIGLMECVLSCTNNIQSVFYSIQNAHTLYMDLSTLGFVQIKFQLFISRYLYIHSFPMPMGYTHGGEINLQKCGMEISWMPYP
jgi:hypothetical protein